MSFREEILRFKQWIDPSKTEVKTLPDHILVFGGECDIARPSELSCRNVLLSLAAQSRHPLSPSFSVPEDYPQWNQIKGYDNLVDFEIDAGCLARAIVLIAETPGALTELGAFCMDPILRKRLLVVIGREHNDKKNSFIVLGSLALIEKANPRDDLSAVCVVDDVKNPASFVQHVPNVLDALSAKLEAEDQSSLFSAAHRRDQFLLIADIVDLFRAISITDIADMLQHMGVTVERIEVEKMIWLLELFQFLGQTQIYGKKFVVAIRGKDNRFIKYHATKGKVGFDRAAFKLQLSTVLNQDATRLKAFQEFKAKK